MLTCKDVATAIGQDEWRTASWRRRLALRVHLLMCRHCCRYAAQIRGHRHGSSEPVPRARRGPEGARAAPREDSQPPQVHTQFRRD